MPFDPNDARSNSEKLNIGEKDLNLLMKMNSSVTNNTNSTFKGVEGIRGDLVHALRNYGWLSDSWNKEYPDQSSSPFMDMLFLFNQWKDGQNFITNNWDYENLPNDLDKWEFETVLLENGKLAVVRTGIGLSIVNFTVTRFESLTKRPIEIQVITEDSTLYDRKFTSENFVIFKNNPQETTILTRGLRYIIGMIVALNELEKNVVDGKTKFIIQTNGKKLVEVDQNDIAEGWNIIFDSSKRVWTVEETFTTNSKNGNGRDMSRLVDPTADTQPDLVTPLQPEDRISQLQEAFLFFRDMYKETLGATPNMMTNKKERNVSVEIEDNKDLAESNIDTMFKIREAKVKELNKKFGLNTSIIRVEQKPIQQEGDPNDNKPKTKETE